MAISLSLNIFGVKKRTAFRVVMMITILQQAYLYATFNPATNFYVR